MNMEHLRYLLTIADCQSISRASEKLNFKQQYLSNIVKRLEAQFGTLIFERHPKGVSLTPDGQYLVDKAREIDRLFQEMQASYCYPSKQIYKESSDNITLYTLPHLNPQYLLEIFEEVQKQFPKVKLHIIEETVPNILKAVQEDPFAVGAIGSLAGKEAIAKQIPAGIKYFFYRFVHPAAISHNKNLDALKYQSLSCEELLNKPLIAYAPFGIEHSVLYQLLIPYGEPHIQYVINNPQLFTKTFKSGDYYTIGDISSTADPDFIQIPIKTDLIWHSALIVREDSLNIFSIKSFINISLAQYHQPLIK